MTHARLVMPALRWRAEDGFRHDAPGIEAALAAGVGGFIIFGGAPEEVRALTADLERTAGRPLLFGADLERGAGQQFPGLAELPPPAALAALEDPAAIRAAGRITALDARTAGIDWLFAPVADLDLEPDNPIVQTRSFGADPAQVARDVTAWIEGARDAGALCCAKHFPGHGRTRQDSHDGTPVVSAAAEDLLRVDGQPFAAAIAADVDAVMTCHVAFPSLDPSGAPATRSRAILNRLRSAGFNGLIVSDALVMEGFGGPRGAADGSIAAVHAGVDVLLYPKDPASVAAALGRAAVEDSLLSDRVAAALVRYEAALARAVAGRAAEAGPDHHPATAALADRLVRREAPATTLRAPLEIVVADDDLDGAFPPSPNDWFRAALGAAGVPLGPGGSRILVAFAEPRASKGRAGFGPRCREVFATEGAGADLAVLFGHPRLAAELPRGVPVLVAWHRQRLMQDAMARWCVERLG